MNSEDLYFEYHKGSKKSNVKFVLLHGWGHSMENMKPIAEELSLYDCYLVDLFGFGKSPVPTRVLSVADYTEYVAKFIKSWYKNGDRVYVIGHSFGGRIAIYLARYYAEIVSGVFVIAGAGLRKRRNVLKKTFVKIAKFCAEIYKFCGGSIEELPLYKYYYRNFASSDFKNANPMMKKILKKTVGENLSAVARKISVPVVLVYGERDTVTPVYFAKKYHRLIKNSELFVLSLFNHTSILTDGKYQVSSIILNNVEK